MTHRVLLLIIFALVVDSNGLDTLHIIAFTHRNLSVNEIGQLHIEAEKQVDALPSLKEAVGLSELMFLSTCNRIEYTLCTDRRVDADFIHELLHELYPNLSSEALNRFVENADVFKGVDAVEHLLLVASSVDSMVVGEREIITQVRNSYELSKKIGITGDLIRILMRHTIETAKSVYTHTNIAKRPVSVVSLAYHKLRDMNVPLDARILIVGAGTTNTNMSRFLKKHGFTNFNVFNRTFAKAEQLANDLGGTAHPLPALKDFTGGFDIIITCTGSENHILTPEIYQQLLQEDSDRKVVIDIAIPQDLSPDIIRKHNVQHISVEVLQKISKENLAARSKEVEHVRSIIAEAIQDFKEIYKERSVELAMRAVPNKVKEIKRAALDEVFRRDVDSLDENAREVLENIIQYMEKKYMSMPMIMAKEILLKKQRR